MVRVINQKHETITEYDLTAGKLYPIKTIKEDAEPIDNVKKFVYTGKDYEDALIYIPNEEKSTKEKAAPSKMDIIEAQIAYTAMMTDTLLEV